MINEKIINIFINCKKYEHCISIKNNFINTILLSIIVTVLFANTASAEQAKVMRDYEFIINSEELNKISLQTTNRIIKEGQNIELTNDEILMLEELKGKPITYIPLNHSGSNNYRNTAEYFNIQVINRLFNLDITYDNSYYTDEEVLEKLASDEIYITSEYLFSDSNLFRNDSSKSIIRTSPYVTNNIFIVHQKNYDYNKDLAKKIGISSRLSSYTFSNNTLLDGEVKVYDSLEARSALLEGSIDYYICEREELKNAVYTSDLVYNEFEEEVTNCQLTLMTNMSNEKESLLSIINKLYTNESIIAEYLYFFGLQYANNMNEVFQYHLTREERDYIAQNKNINIGFISTLVLLEDNIGTFSGLIVEELDIINKLTGLNINYNSYNVTSYKDILARMDKSEIDMLPIVLNTKENIEYFEKEFKYLKFDITDSFMEEDIEIIKVFDTKQLASYSELNFSKVGILSAETIIMYPFFESINFVNYDELKIYNNAVELSNAIINGDINYGLALPGFLQYTNVFQNSMLVHADIFLKKGETDEWSFLINLKSDSKDNKNLVSIINKSLPVKKTLYLEQYFLDSNKVYNDEFKKSINNNQILSSFLFFTILILGVVLVNLRITKKSAMKLDYDISYDSVTNFKNYQSYLKLDKSKNDLIILNLIELTQLNKVIEFYGTSIGNQVVEEVAKRIRNLDIEYDYTPYRVKADKFIIVINYKKNDKISADWLKEELLDILTKKYNINNFNIKMNFKVVSLDSAMYNDTLQNNFKALESAANEVQVTDSTVYRFLSEKDIVKSRMEKQIEKSLMEFENEAILPFFQPLISSENEKIIGCEVLARMQNKGEILPAWKFIPLAKKKGLLGKIDKLLFEKSIMIRNELLEQGIIDEKFYFSINASVQMLREFDVVYLRKIKDKYNLKNFDFLQIELLEEFMESEFIESSVGAMKENNLRIAIDDFSAGHSSLTRITSKYFDVVKIDRGVMPIQFKDEHKVILKFIIELLKGMGYKIISEGVETKEHVDFLTDMKVDIFQGYYYSRPVPLDEFISYIKSRNFEN